MVTRTTFGSVFSFGFISRFISSQPFVVVDIQASASDICDDQGINIMNLYPLVTSGYPWLRDCRATQTLSLVRHSGFRILLFTLASAADNDNVNVPHLSLSSSPDNVSCGRVTFTAFVSRTIIHQVKVGLDLSNIISISSSTTWSQVSFFKPKQARFCSL